MGTTVRVIFPVATDDTPVARKRRPTTAPTAANDETILLVEDEQIVREPTRRMLAEPRLHGAGRGQRRRGARDRRADHPGEIHLLLTDVVMPGRSGKELSTIVGELRPATRTLFMSGYSHDLIVHQGVLEEGVHLIEKPFSAENLLRTVREVLDGDR